MIVNLDIAKKTIQDLHKFASDPQLLYVDCESRRMTLSAYLETLDPSEKDEAGNPVSKYDAFDRLAMALGIELSGPNAFTLEKLYAGDNALMVPELIKREIEAGMAMAARSAYKDLVAAVVPTDQTTYHPIYIPDLDRDTAVKRRKYSLGERAAAGKGADFPVFSLQHREKDVVIGDFGREIQAPYSLLKGRAWPDLRVFFWLLGAQIAVDKIYAIYDLGVHGDGTVGAATNVFNGTGGTLTYADLVHAYTSFNQPFQMNALLCPQQSEEAILTMPQFQDPLSGWKFQKTGEPVTPMGGTIRSIGPTPGATPVATVIVAIDKRFAVREIVTQGLMVETDKIISKKFEKAVVSDESAFSIVADGAIKQIVWT